MKTKSVLFAAFLSVGSIFIGTTYATEWVSLSGTVKTSDGTPVCAMVLANGQHVFSCGPIGEYSSYVPLDSNGQITLYCFCEGMMPFKTVLEGIETNFNISMVASKADLFEEVLKRGKVNVGVMKPDFLGFYQQNGDKGLEADLGRALAAAIFSDKNKVEFVKVSVTDRFTALEKGSYDVLFGVSTFTMGRDTSLNLNFAPTYFYDGQGIMTHEGWNLEDLNGKLIGVLEGDPYEYNLDRYITKQGLYPQVVLFANQDEMFSYYDQGLIDAVSSDKISLNAHRALFVIPSTHVIFTDTFSMDPLAPVVREGDDVWYDIVKWVIYALIQAEELGIDSSNVDYLLGSPDPDIRRFLGVEGSLGQNLRLSSDWAYQIIKQVGNYGEIYDRNLGSLTSGPLPRGQNSLYLEGGLHYSPLMR